jgi:FtsH-binding integral membrane protein
VATSQSVAAEQTHRYTMWCWLTVGLVPVGWLVGVEGATRTGPEGGGGPSLVLMAVLPVVVMVLAPTAAVKLATDAVRAEQRSGRGALVVSGLLLLATLVGLLSLGASGTGIVVVAVAFVVTLGVFGVTHGWRGDSRLRH